MLPKENTFTVSISHPVGVVLGDVDEPGQLPPALGIVVDLPGNDAESGVGAFNRVTIAALALPLHGVIELGGIINITQQKLVQPAAGMIPVYRTDGIR